MAETGCSVYRTYHANNGPLLKSNFAIRFAAFSKAIIRGKLMIAENIRRPGGLFHTGNDFAFAPFFPVDCHSCGRAAPCESTINTAFCYYIFNT
jgi:hypothetical protein